MEDFFPLWPVKVNESDKDDEESTAEADDEDVQVLQTVHTVEADDPGAEAEEDEIKKYLKEIYIILCKNPPKTEEEAVANDTDHDNMKVLGPLVVVLSLMDISFQVTTFVTPTLGGPSVVKIILQKRFYKQ